MKIIDINIPPPAINYIYKCVVTINKYIKYSIVLFCPTLLLVKVNIFSFLCDVMILKLFGLVSLQNILKNEGPRFRYQPWRPRKKIYYRGH